MGLNATSDPTQVTPFSGRISRVVVEHTLLLRLGSGPSPCPKAALTITWSPGVERQRTPSMLNLLQLQLHFFCPLLVQDWTLNRIERSSLPTYLPSITYHTRETPRKTNKSAQTGHAPRGATAAPATADTPATGQQGQTGSAAVIQDTWAPNTKSTPYADPTTRQIKKKKSSQGSRNSPLEGPPRH